MPAPTNLTSRALDDYEAVLTESLAWGTVHSMKLRALLQKHFEEIGRGVAIGRLRDDLPFRVETRSLRVGKTPYLIFFRPTERLVVPIRHGHRDLPTVFHPRALDPPSQ